jgi:integrase/recombinase XerD
MGTMRFSVAMDGFELSCRGRGLSENTISDYLRTLKKYLRFYPADPLIDTITRRDVEAFMAAQDVSRKSALNYHIGLSAFWTWCLREQVATVHIIRGITPPRPEKRVIVPLTEAEVKAVFSATSRSRRYQRAGSVPADHSLGTALRSRAILLLLLDTGMRASELVNLRCKDMDIKAGHVLVFGKGRKERRIPFSPRTGQAIWKYHSSFPVRPGTEDFVFQVRGGKPLTRNGLAHRLQEIGTRAGVDNVHPHRFRHTFAINYLRNGGDVYTLQAILGHHTLEMCRRYLSLAQVDLEQAHRRASPVEHWRL